MRVWICVHKYSGDRKVVIASTKEKATELLKQNIEIPSQLKNYYCEAIPARDCLVERR